MKIVFILYSFYIIRFDLVVGLHIAVETVGHEFMLLQFVAIRFMELTEDHFFL